MPNRKQATANYHSNSNTINFICDGLYCTNYAFNKVDVKAGRFVISLNLCSSCIKKFQLPNENVQVNPTSPTKTSSIPNNNHSNTSITFCKNKQYLTQRNE
jgi:hypothetical protein